jgi:hypothetical protein
MNLVGLVVVIVLVALAMWVVSKFSGELGPFLTKLFQVVIIVFCVIVVLLFFLQLFGFASGITIPHVVK